MNLIRLPQMICFRITRRCNAFCNFCLAPSDDVHPDMDTLRRRMDWLLEHGVKTLHFCGGEPTLHESLPELLTYTVNHGGKAKLTTNAIRISESLLHVLYNTGTQVKVSIHGNRELHNRIVGSDFFDLSVDNLRLLVRSGIPTTVQTTLVCGESWVVEWMVRFCLDLGVKGLSFLPFIPRGRGGTHREAFELLPLERIKLRELVKTKRREFSGRLDIRWLDFNSQPLIVADADGRLIMEGASETSDRVLCEKIEGNENGKNLNNKYLNFLH